MSFEEEYGNVFTPGAPVAQRRLVFGRDAELQKLRRYLQRPGYHPMIIGDRGVGKTTLAVHALATTSHHTIGCDDEMDFNRLAHAALRNAKIIDRTISSSSEDVFEGKGGVEIPGILKVGVKGEGKDVHLVKGAEDVVLGPWEAYELIRDHSERVVLVFDEFDVVPKESNVHSGIARLIKNFADNHRTCDSRIVLVGIARTAQQLLGNHPSIQRSLREIFLRPLTADDIVEFLDRAEKRLGFRFSPTVKRALVDESNGFPYFVHLVGLECLDVMTERDSRARLVTEGDYERALERAVQEAFRSELQKWRVALAGMDREERLVVRALVESRQLTPKRAELESRLVQGHLSGVAPIGGGLTPQEFSHALVKLQQEKRLVYLSRGRDDVRFFDPLMKPFLRILFLPTPFSKRMSRYVHEDQISLFDEDED